MKAFIKKYRYELLILFLILSISFVHYYTNSVSSPIHNPLRLLFIVPIIMAAFKYGFKGGIITSTLASLIYSPHLLLAINIKIQTINELMDIVLFFAVGILTGIFTEKKISKVYELESALKRMDYLERYTTGIIESIKSGVVAVNNDMLITIINQGAKKILALSDEAIGMDVSEVFNCCSEIVEVITKSAREGNAYENKEKSYDINGKVVDIRISIYPLALQNANKGLVIIIEDITEIKKIQKNIQRTDKLAALGELSAGVAHEIRNPLAVIKAIAQTMKNELRENNGAVQELEIINEEVERSNKIVKALMEFAKPDKNQYKMNDVNAIMNEVLVITNKYVSQHNVEVSVKQDQLPEIYCDKGLMKQAFINIIFNSIEAMPEGGNLAIATRLSDKDYIEIVFEDAGCGIESVNLEKIFNPFFTTKDEGTGLGLSIVHRIIEEHCGEINVSSAPGEGTSFEIRLPVIKEVSEP